MKKLTFKGMLDNLRSSVAGVADAVTGANKFECDPDENVRPQDFAISEVSRHGFPQDPTSIAFEPVQRIIAIGTRQGSIRLIGRPGVDYFLKHPATSINGISTEQTGADRDALLGNSSTSVNPNAVLQILFLVNEGTFIAVTASGWLHLWNYRLPQPDVTQSLEFQKEVLTVCHVPYQSKWLFVGTEKGNVLIVQLDTFSISAYVINWNKAMDLASRNHPGKVIHLSDCPYDATKLLIGFDSGLITLWDLKAKTAEIRLQAAETLCHISWHFDGKQFVSSHSDGTLAVWNIKTPGKPISVTSPHLRRSKDDPVIPISQVEWKKHKSGTEPLLLFSGGVSFDQKASSVLKNMKTQTMTIIHGKSTTVLEMEHPIVAFLCIPSQPWSPDGNDNDAVVVLLENDLVAIDLVTPGYPLYENPYPMDLHEPPLLHCHYISECPTDVIPTLYTTGAKHKKTNFTDKEWPIVGGIEANSSMGYSDFLLTSHCEGTIRFWDVSSASLQHLDRLKISKIFERVRKGSHQSIEPSAVGTDAGIATAAKSSSSMLDGPFDIQVISLDPECRYLAVACVGGLVILYLWNKLEVSTEVAVLEIAINYDSHESSIDTAPSLPAQTSPPPSSLFPPKSSDMPANGGQSSHRKIKVKSGLHKRAAGFQPVMVCFTDAGPLNTSPSLVPEETQRPGPPVITSLAVSSKYGLLAIGNEIGLAVVDIIQRHCVMSIGTPDLYGSGDPYNRGSKSPRNERPPFQTNDQPQHLDLTNEKPSSSVSPKHRPSSAAAGASSAKSRQSTVDQKPKLHRDKSQAVAMHPHQHPRTPVLQRMQSIAHSFDSDLLKEPRRRPRQSSKDRAIHSSLEKADLSRSRSSSSSSLDVVTSEAILCLKFADTYGRKADVTISPCLWIGTGLGSVLVLTFQISSCADLSQPQQTQRLSQPVIGTPTGSQFRYNNSGAVLTIELLDARGTVLPDGPSGPTPPVSGHSSKDEPYARAPKLSDAAANMSTAIPPLACLLADSRHVLVLCMERQIRTFILPSQGLYQKLKLQDQNTSSFATFLKASVQRVKDNACIFCYLSSGKIAVFSLPTLKPLLELPLSQPNDLRMARTMSFAQHGNAVYLLTKSELQKVTFSAETAASMGQLNGILHTTRETVESAPKSSVVPSVGFLKGLMGAASTQVLSSADQLAKDRDELFGEAAGRGSKSIARHVPGSMDHARASATNATSEIARAKLLAMERGEKLSEVEERTEQMRLQAEAFAGSASQLANRYKEKKWYQM